MRNARHSCLNTMSVHMRETRPRFDCDYDLACNLDLCFKVVAAATASLPLVAHAQLAKADAVIGS